MKRDLIIQQVTRASYLATLTTPSQTQIAYTYLRNMLADEAREDSGELFSIPHDGRTRLQKAASVVVLTSILHKEHLRHTILEYLHTMDARALRRASKDCKEAVLSHPWHDETVVRHVPRWHNCFPCATLLCVGGYGMASITEVRDIPTMRMDTIRILHLRSMPGQVVDRALQHMPLVEELVLHCCAFVTPGDVALLPRLRKLCVDNCPEMNSEDLMLLIHVTELVHDGLSDETIECLPAPLEQLSLTDTSLVTETGLAKLERYPKLRSLSLDTYDMDDASFLQHLPQLQSLSVRDGNAVIYQHALQQFIDSPAVFTHLCRQMWDHWNESVWIEFVQASGTDVLCRAICKYTNNECLVQVVCSGWAQKVMESHLPVHGIPNAATLCNSISSLLTVWEWHSSSGDVRDAVLECLKEHVVHPHFFQGNNNSIQQLIVVMRACKKEESICESCCATLVEVGLPVPRQEAVREVVDVLRTHSTNPDIVLKACLLIDCAYSGTEDLRELELVGDIVGLLNKAMSVHIRNKRVAVQAYKTLHVLAPMDRRAAASLAVIDALVDGPQSLDMIMSAGDVILELCTTPADALPVSTLGGTQLFIETLKKRPRSSRVVEHLCRVLGRLAQLEPVIAERMAQSSAFIRMLCNAITYYSSNARHWNVAYQLCLGIQSLLGNRQAELELVTSGAIPALAAALKVMAPANDYRAAPLCTIIEHIARGCHGHQIEFGRLGVISTLLDLFVAPGMPVACREHVIATMLALLDAPENQAIFVARSGMQALVDALRMEPTVASHGIPLANMSAVLTANPAYAQQFTALGGAQLLVGAMHKYSRVPEMAMWAGKTICNVAAHESSHTALIAASAATALRAAASFHAGDARIVPSIETALGYLDYI
jgi:hypothetical protein